MEYLGAILFVMTAFYHLVYVLLHKPNSVGTIITTEDDSIYVELDGEESLNKIRDEKYVVFRTTHKKH